MALTRTPALLRPVGCICVGGGARIERAFSRHVAPRHGVVDETGRVYGTSHLLIADSSVFPSGGYANPTLTIVALAVRLGDYLKWMTSRGSGHGMSGRPR